MDWELELGVVIGKRARFVTRERALEHVAGYMVVNDLTIRERVNRKDMQEMGMDWVGSKCAPTALPTGPYLVPAAFVGDPQKLHITLTHNGRVMQDEGTDDMIFDCARLIETLSNFMALQPGDLICTGSPSGNGIHHGVLLKPGDVMEGSDHRPAAKASAPSAIPAMPKSNPVKGWQLDRASLRTVGRDLQRPECILAQRDGTLWSADARGGVMRIGPDGSQQLIAQQADTRFTERGAGGASATSSKARCPMASPSRATATS